MFYCYLDKFLLYQFAYFQHFINIFIFNLFGIQCFILYLAFGFGIDLSFLEFILLNYSYFLSTHDFSHIQSFLTNFCIFFMSMNSINFKFSCKLCSQNCFLNFRHFLVIIIAIKSPIVCSILT
jgi:hypothetical protein